MTLPRLEALLFAATALMVVSVAVALAGLTWRVMGEPGGRARAPAAAPRPVVVAVATNLSPILLAAPFGAAPDPQMDPGSSAGSGFQLRGILRARRMSASTALISAGEGKVQSVGVGQSVGAATVESIEIDHVILDLGGRRERLGFPQRGAGPNAGPTAGVAAIRALIPEGVAGVPSGSPTPAPTTPMEPASAVEVYRERLAASPQTLLGALGAAPTPQGYRIGASPSPDMRRAGLIPGDVVATINGQSVGDVERDRQLFEQAVASGRARVEVIRDGRRIVLSFPLR